MSTRTQLLERIASFLEATGMNERSFGVAAVADHRFIKRLRDGAGLTLTSIEKAEAFMAGMLAIRNVQREQPQDVGGRNIAQSPTKGQAA